MNGRNYYSFEQCYLYRQILPTIEQRTLRAILYHRLCNPIKDYGAIHRCGHRYKIKTVTLILLYDLRIIL